MLSGICTPDRGLAPQQIDADLYLFVGVLCFVDGRDDALEYVGVAKVILEHIGISIVA